MPLGLILRGRVDEMNDADREQWQEEVRTIYEKIRGHKEAYHIEVNGLKIKVLPNVFSPGYFADSAFFAREIPQIVGKSSLLEIGTGTGVVTLAAALNGAEVYATDINLDAVENADINFFEYDVKVCLLEGDVFDALPNVLKVDFIFWNHPFNRADQPVDDMLLRAGFDHDYKGLRKYISGARGHLNPEGTLLLGTGNFADLDEMARIAEANKFRPVLLKKEETELSPGTGIKNDFRIYHLEDLTR